MRIGFDVQLLRLSRSGIGSYIKHLYEWLCHLAPVDDILPFVYGPAGLEEPEAVRLLQALSPARKLHHYWDGPSLWLLSHYLRANSTHAPRLARKIDRRILLPLWERLMAMQAINPNRLHWVSWPGQEDSWEKVDLCHHPGVIILPPHRFRGNVLTVHDLTTLCMPQFHHPGNIELWKGTFDLVPQMDGLIAVSESTKRDLVTMLGIEEELIDVVPEAAHEQFRPIEDPEKVRSVLSRYELAGQPYVIHVGTFEPRKNLCRLLEAFQSLKQQEPALGHQLLLVGEKGWMYEPIFETIQRLHLESQVRWLDYVSFEDLPALLNGAHLLVFPSLYEGFGLPPLEAMSCGTPVIASNSTSLPEVVGDAGILVDPEQVGDLAAAIRCVLTDHTLRATLRARGLAQAKKFSWERAARLTLTAYEKAYRRSRGRGRKRPQEKGPKTTGSEFMREWVIARANEIVSRGTNPEARRSR
jgi:glycosyltransferase involved in cell wall biosynthesis